MPNDRVARIAVACATFVQYCGWLFVIAAIALVVFVGSVKMTSFRYNGF